MLHSLFRYLQGYLRIRIKGYSPERFINLCKNKNIDIWGLGYNLDSYEMYIKVKDFRKLKPLLKKTVTKVSILERFGLPFFFYNYRKRQLFFVGIGACIFIIYAMTLFIWKIDLKGNQMITNDVLLEYLDSQNISHGMFKSKVHCEQIAKDIRKNFNDIIWVSASMDGTCLSIHVKENTDTFSVDKEEETASDIIADKTGIVVSIVTRKGVPLVTVGDEVTAGDVLVSGTIDVLNDAKEVVSQYTVSADADIVLETVRLYEDFVPKQYIKKKYTDKKRSLWTLKFKNYAFDFGVAKNKFKNSQIHTKETQIRLEENFYLPIFIGKKEISEYEKKTMEYSKDEMENLLNTRFEQYCKDLTETAIILEKSMQITHDKEGAKATSTLILQESAGIHRKIVAF